MRADGVHEKMQRRVVATVAYKDRIKVSKDLDMIKHDKQTTLGMVIRVRRKTKTDVGGEALSAQDGRPAPCPRIAKELNKDKMLEVIRVYISILI